MKKILFSLISLALALVIMMPSPPLHAGGGSSPLIRLSVSKSQALANGSDAITLSVHLFRYECNGTHTYIGGPENIEITYHPIYTASYDASAYCTEQTDSNDSGYHEIDYNETIFGSIWPYLTLSGSNVKFDPSTFTEDNYPAGTVTTKLTSTMVGTKTITASGSSNWTGHDTVTVNFTTSTSATTTKDTTGATTQTKQSNTETNGSSTVAQQSGDKNQPAAPVLDAVSVSGEKILVAKIEGSKLGQSDKKVFSGKTIPNGVVRLYFHSDPFEDTVTADKTGSWSYELKKDIGAGSHTLQIAVTDPVTKLTSEKSQPTNFTLVAGTVGGGNQLLGKSTIIWFIVGGAIILPTLAGIGFRVLGKR